MTKLISQAFKDKKKKLVTFVTGGDPDIDTSLEIIETIINNGVDILEIGMPFLTQWLMVQQFNYQVIEL